MSTISRRTVIGTAWAAPVIIAAVAAPTAAASGGETHPLGMSANPASSSIRRSSSPPISAPVTITITNNTERATEGSVIVSLPFRTADEVCVMEFDMPDNWFVSFVDGDLTLISNGPLSVGESRSFRCQFGSSGNRGFKTVMGVVTLTATAPNARTATLPVQVISVPY